MSLSLAVKTAEHYNTTVHTTSNSTKIYVTGLKKKIQKLIKCEITELIRNS